MSLTTSQREHMRGMVPGARVRSHYRGRWSGIVLEVGRVDPYTGGAVERLVLVRPTHTVDGRPIRKAAPRWLDAAWLEVLP